MKISVINNIRTPFKANSIEINGKETKAKIYTYDVDYKAINQIKTLCNHPAFHDAPIRIMPDVHPSTNTVVGFSAPIVDGKIIPSVIGGDIGCGMLCVKLNTQNQDIDFEKLDKVVRTYASAKRTELPNSLKKVPNELDRSLKTLSRKIAHANGATQQNGLGTLGGGNHFIEIDTDSKGQHYLVIHTGSRSIGQQVADHHQNIAKQQNPYFIKELSYLSGDEAKQYLLDMRVAQEYAKANRRVIADEILYRMGWKEIDSFESVHNYISDDGIIRKGAIAAEKGRDLLIPLNMKDGVILGRGKGNAEWNNTAPHGSGRKMARRTAQETLDFSEFVSSMNGIFSTSVRPETLDESPKAYKDSSEIIENISETADVQEVIRPVYNYKD